MWWTRVCGSTAGASTKMRLTSYVETVTTAPMGAVIRFTAVSGHARTLSLGARR